MSQLIILGGINKQTNEYVQPRFAKKCDDYKCPDCDKDLTLCKGDIRAHYFRHKTESNDANRCEYYDNPGETQIHKDSKLALKMLLERFQAKGIPLHILHKCVSCGDVEEYEIELSNTSHVILEYMFEKYSEVEREALGKKNKIADLAVVENVENSLSCVFEIYHTHKTLEEDRPEPWFELHATTLLNQMRNCKDIDKIKLHCTRNTKCDTCLDNVNNTVIEKCKVLDTKPLGEILQDEKNLELYVRYKLGQREFNECRYEGKKSSHERFDFDSRNENNKANDEIMQLFEKFMDVFCVITHTHKGGLWYKIISKNEYSTYNNRYLLWDNSYDMGYIGTVDAVMDMLKKLHGTLQKISIINQKIIDCESEKEDLDSMYINRSKENHMKALKMEKDLISLGIDYKKSQNQSHIYEIMRHDSCKISLTSNQKVKITDIKGNNININGNIWFDIKLNDVRNWYIGDKNNMIDNIIKSASQKLEVVKNDKTLKSAFDAKTKGERKDVLSKYLANNELGNLNDSDTWYFIELYKKYYVSGDGSEKFKLEDIEKVCIGKGGAYSTKCFQMYVNNMPYNISINRL